METKLTSKQFSLNINDFLKGLLMAMGVPVLVVIQSAVEAGNFNLDWKMLVKIAVGGLVAYLLKNFMTPSTVTAKVTNDQVEAIKESSVPVMIKHPAI